MTRYDVGAPQRRAGLSLLFVLVATACSSAAGGGPRGPADTITREQITSLPDGTAFQVVQRFKSQWLRPRGQGTPSSPGPEFPQVFVDEMYYGDIDSLSRFSSTSIESIQYISANDATTRYGTGYMGGIIRINTLGRLP